MRVLFNFLFLFLILVGCSQENAKTVGYLCPSINRARFVNEGNYMEERLKELGIKMITKHADDDDALQLQQGYELLNQGVDALIIACVNGNTIAPLVREANRRGVKVIAYNRLINNTEYDLFVTGDNADIAKLFVDAALSRRPRGNYVVLAGDRFDRNGFEVKFHIDSLLRPHIEAGRINLVYESYIEGWSGVRSRFEMQQVIDAHGTDIDAVIACSDPMGLGALDILDRYGLKGSVVVTGQDATIESVRSVYRGEQTMSIYHPHRVLGHKVAELTSQLLGGSDASQLSNAQTFNGVFRIPTYQMKSIAITRDNLQELVDIGEYSWNEIRN